ncbi:hypothetical protein C3486_04210 [Streptomyces sp. Ru73]|uniref:Phenylacetic acid catabolic protein n=1 Tax=Streptomyces sp. Ru73 TaxID=2080748 RepID=UPI000CDE43FF|nr:hypothetical protein [Streptomyces sp. Ru73]POX42497.1 hypothetical protein C3486_04210 [Streptomyces sp. Ru73]
MTVSPETPGTRRAPDGLLVFEVFLQSGSTTPLAHVGSLLAEDEAQAWRLARDTYGRRDNAVRLWVVPRADVHAAESDSRRLLNGKSRMPYRLPAFPQERRRRRAGLHRDTGETPAAAVSPAPATVPDGAAALWPALADDLFLHAHRLAERTVDYTELEEALAVGSIAQEDLAHARTLLELLGYGEAEADAHFFDRPAALWQPTALTASARDGRPWAVARGLCVAAGAAALALCSLDVPGLGPAATAALTAVADEQRLHLAHWSARVTQYARRGRTADIAAALDTAGREAAALFGAPALPAPGADAGPGAAADSGWGAAAEPPADSLTKQFDTLVRDTGLPPALVPALPASPPRRTTGEGRTGLGEVLAELRTVRAGYPQGAFL